MRLTEKSKRRQGLAKPDREKSRTGVFGVSGTGNIPHALKPTGVSRIQGQTDACKEKRTCHKKITFFKIIWMPNEQK
ncbi:hypothetical protein H8S57_10590 [Lawsonibacter sp. NSJ-51]|uniref:Uncharacterized protein n=1 Tax=Lawsonibacter hominis TaxID=2763053 RepID=A0A8J6JFB3_9FIRM|nr:hypothetical protein [Lawsonibacter hominis]